MFILFVRFCNVHRQVRHALCVLSVLRIFRFLCGASVFCEVCCVHIMCVHVVCVLCFDC